MDLPINLSNRAARWAAVFGGSTLLWVAPVGLRAPKLLIFLSLPSAIAGFTWCAIQAHSWRYASAYGRKHSTLMEELENHEFALREAYLKANLEAQYYPPAPQPEYQPQESWGPFTLHPSVPPVQLGPSPQKPAANKTYTVHGLSLEDARQLLAQMLKAELTKEAIIWELWQVKKGGSKRYKEALAEYAQIESPTLQ